ncbi:MAG: iron donor protein CyaY [Rhodospirillales bacterium]|nr:iron donor protein CyaY [Rhodospirillales bacterium]
MSLDESHFHAIADNLLHHLVDRVDEAVGETLDVDLHGGVMTVDLASGGSYIINKHAPNRQIWLSSPRSGAWHFDYDEASGSWLSSRPPRLSLTSILAQELSEATGTAIGL